MRILVASDAWYPQVNGVVRTYQRLSEEVQAFDSVLAILSPRDFRSFSFPLYPEIRLAIPDQKNAGRLIEDADAEFIHIATEGPVGRMVRRYCLQQGRAFTTSYHTKFPEYLQALAGVPTPWTYRILRKFHNASAGTMAATASLAQDLEQRGFENILRWTRGVDTQLFKPRDVRLFGTEKPVFLYVGRVSKEKNIRAFLELDLPGRKVIVGDGPQKPALERDYPDATFTGSKTGEDLARHYASADVFVFPSRTDTFGLVVLEAMASGVPVAAFPVTGPIDVIENDVSGIVGQDLKSAALQALNLNSRSVRRHAERFSWRQATERFLDNIVSANRAYRVPTHGAQVAALPPSETKQPGAIRLGLCQWPNWRTL